MWGLGLEWVQITKRHDAKSIPVYLSEARWRYVRGSNHHTLAKSLFSRQQYMSGCVDKDVFIEKKNHPNKILYELEC